MEGFGESLTDMTFERLLELCKPRIDFQAKNFQSFLKDMDYDDIYQELSIKLWKMWKKKKFPHDIFDFRTTRYIDIAFIMEVYQLRKVRIPRGLYLKKIYIHKDAYYHCEDISSHL